MGLDIKILSGEQFCFWKLNIPMSSQLGLQLCCSDTARGAYAVEHGSFKNGRMQGIPPSLCYEGLKHGRQTGSRVFILIPFHCLYEKHCWNSTLEIHGWRRSENWQRAFPGSCDSYWPLCFHHLIRSFSDPHLANKCEGWWVKAVQESWHLLAGNSCGVRRGIPCTRPVRNGPGKEGDLIHGL